MGANCGTGLKNCGSAGKGGREITPDQTAAPPPEDVEALMKSPWYNWGSIEYVVNEPLENVGWEASWLSVAGLYLLLPVNLLIGVLVGLIQFLFTSWSSLTICSVKAGNPIYLIWVWWSYVVAGLTALVAQARSRLGLFLWEKDAFGGGDYFWHGQGIWATTYSVCSDILKSEQDRGPAFGAFTAPVPDIFPKKLLIFLPNIGNDNEWRYLRQALHEVFLTHTGQTYQLRQKSLPRLIADQWPGAQLQDLTKDTARLQELVSKCVFYMLFGVWVTDEEAKTLSAWRSYASLFVLPRLVQRAMFNLGIRKVKQLRIDTVRMIEKYKLEDIFSKMNDLLPQRYRRDPVVKLCDEILYVIGFAGIGGTSAMCETAAAFFQLQTPAEFPRSRVDFSKYDNSEMMIQAYNRDPFNFLKECCRIDPPVTSATSVLKEEMSCLLNGRKNVFPKGMFRQYALSLANRDQSVFQNPQVFDPDRTDLDKALSWNGAFGEAGYEKTYPRICPGRYLSLDVGREIFSFVVANEASHTNQAMQKALGGAK
eukprot:TRINITY_DN32402_c0_g1_i1.p1 TRINITY_DN32402_c0_g1~~TRINITY_DN32402_c0_g1_i1.p1  ORF type:complete len:537 (+),score=82.48 TRINITY_DN32402_c0_g1_i1:34-1644(+)